MPIRIALLEASRHAYNRECVYASLDEAFRRHLGLVKVGPPEYKKPADLASYIEDTVCDDTLGSVKCWRKVIHRNPEDERKVFPYFKDYVLSIIDNGRLTAAFPTQIADEAIPKVRDWIVQKEEKLSQNTIHVERASQAKCAFEDFIIKEPKKVMRFIHSEMHACKRKQCKLVAMLLIVLQEEGYLVEYERKQSAIHNALRAIYPNKIGVLTGIVDYINSRRKPDYTGEKKVHETELTLLRNKLNKFVE